MDVVRARVGSAVEWVVAAAFLLATLAVGSMVLRELRAAASVGPDTARAATVVSAASALPAHVAGRAVSVPLLILAPEKEIKVGDTAARVAAVLGREAETGVQQSDIGRWANGRPATTTTRGRGSRWSSNPPTATRR